MEHVLGNSNPPGDGKKLSESPAWISTPPTFCELPARAEQVLLTVCCQSCPCTPCLVSQCGGGGCSSSDMISLKQGPQREEMPGGDEDDTAAGDMRLLKQGCWKEVWRLAGISVTRTPLSKTLLLQYVDFFYYCKEVLAEVIHSFLFVYMFSGSYLIL